VNQSKTQYEFWKFYNQQHGTNSFYSFYFCSFTRDTRFSHTEGDIETQNNWKTLRTYNAASFDNRLYDLQPFWNLGNISLDGPNK